MRKRIVDIGEVQELGCAGNAAQSDYGDVELEELSDAELEALDDGYVTRTECVQAFQSAAQGGLMLGSLLGGLLGVGLGAAGAALIAHHYADKKR